MRKAAIVVFILLGTAAAGSLTIPSDWLAATARGQGQASSPSRITTNLRLLDGPLLESTTATSAIVRWTTNGVDGTTVRYGVVHYGVDPRVLGLTSKSQNRWNRGLSTMVYRVQLSDLEPGRTYYYSVEAADANGVTEGTLSGVQQFTTQRSSY
jgi:hypothetical protein